MIGIDVHVIGERETGNETYTMNLVRALLAAAPQRTFGLFTPHPERLPEDIGRATNAQIVPVRPGNSLLRVPLSFPYTLARAGAELVHVNYVLPPICPCPGVATVHDLSYALFPDDAPPRDKMVLGRLLPMSVRKARAVIAVSQNTRKDIVSRFHVPEERITVIYEAAPPHIRRVMAEDELQRVCATYGITGDYVLAVGNLQPRKNLSRLVDAFAVIRRRHLTAQLVIVGQARWRESEVMRLVQERGLSKNVVFTGYVPDADLPALYSGASVFVYVSLYEGFGLPVLEAMTCGAPVITSKTSSLPEVAGDAALLVDPTSVPELADALQAVLTQGDMAARLSQRGLRRAAMFSWARAAQQTLEVYEKVLRDASVAKGAASA